VRWWWSSNGGAKDCIDIQIRVPRLNEAMIVPSFAELGFRLRPEPWNHIELTAGRQWPKLVFALPVGERAANVHVRATSSATARRNLLFRDFLRADPTARHAWPRSNSAWRRSSPISPTTRSSSSHRPRSS
jgi:GrpB-like predicted nucleotidyltransferase (UPF0157 family)